MGQEQATKKAEKICSKCSTAHKRKNGSCSSQQRSSKKKYTKRSLRLRVGDKVKILRGTHKGEEQKIESVDIKKTRVYIEKMDLTKKDGSKTRIPFHPSNLMLTDLNLDDKKKSTKTQRNKKRSR